MGGGDIHTASMEAWLPLYIYKGPFGFLGMCPNNMYCLYLRPVGSKDGECINKSITCNVLKVLVVHRNMSSDICKIFGLTGPYRPLATVLCQFQSHYDMQYKVIYSGLSKVKHSVIHFSLTHYHHHQVPC